MKLLQVNYRREHGQDNKDQAEYLLAAAERIAEAPGLQWKIWIHDDENQAAGGIYLFDSAEHARAFGDGIPASLSRVPGVSDVDRRYYDVDDRLSAITRGPVATPQQA
jgi:Putative mono-oxygenase ydhR